MNIPDDILATEVTYTGKDVRGEPQDVRFFLDMMPFKEGQAAWVNLRYQIAKAGVIDGAGKMDLAKAAAGATFTGGKIQASADVVRAGQEALVGVLNALMGVEPAVLADIQDRQFKHIRFQIGTNNAMPLKGMEDMAFRGMPVVRAEQLMLRSLAVNFQPSLSAALSGFSHVFLTIGTLFNPSTSTDS